MAFRKRRRGFVRRRSGSKGRELFWIRDWAILLAEEGEAQPLVLSDDWTTDVSGSGVFERGATLTRLKLDIGLAFLSTENLGNATLSTIRMAVYITDENEPLVISAAEVLENDILWMASRLTPLDAMSPALAGEPQQQTNAGSAYMPIDIRTKRRLNSSQEVRFWASYDDAQTGIIYGYSALVMKN